MHMKTLQVTDASDEKICFGRVIDGPVWEQKEMVQRQAQHLGH